MSFFQIYIFISDKALEEMLFSVLSEEMKTSIIKKIENILI